MSSLTLDAGRFAALMILSAAPVAAAADPAWSLSPDVTLELDGQVVADHEIGEDDGLGTTTLIDLGPLPTSSDVTAIHRQTNGDAIFALDTAVELGGSAYAPGDVIRWDGAAHSLFFDAAGAGLPAGVVTDAMSVASNGDLLLSFDTSVEINTGASVVAADEDVIRFSGGTPSLEFDGSVAGVPEAFDIDGLQVSNGRLGVSFDTGGVIAGIAFHDEDVLEYDPGLLSWSLLIDASNLHAGLAPADVDAIAIPEPDALHGLVAGIPTLYFLARRARTNGRARNKGSFHDQRS